MSFLHGHERAAACRCHLAVRLERCLDDRTIALRLHNLRAEVQRGIDRRGALEDDVEVGGDRTRWGLNAGLPHQVDRRGPVAVAIEERAADAAVEDAVEGLVVRLGVPLADERVSLFEAADAEAFLVGWSAAEALVVRRVCLLKALAHHLDDIAMTSGKNSAKSGSRCARAPHGRRVAVSTPGRRE